MNLKEAFRVQNCLTTLLRAAEMYVAAEDHIVEIEEKHLRSKVRPEQADETLLVRQEEGEPLLDINAVVDFVLLLLGEKAKLNQAIRKAKNGVELDMDGAIELNMRKQSVSSAFRQMCRLQSHEQICRNQGTGYHFNQEGNQVVYRYDIKRVTTIRFNRNKVRALAKRLTEEADATSAQLDKLMIETAVDYTCPLDINADFQELVAAYAETAEKN